MSGPNCYLLTSDMLRDHSSKLDDSIRGYFCKWLEQRKITFKQRSNQVMVSIGTLESELCPLAVQ